MQLLLSAVLSLLAVGPSVCLPMDGYNVMDRAYPVAYPSMEQLERARLQTEMEGSYLSNRNQELFVNEQANGRSNYDPYYTADSQASDADTPLPKDAVDELKKQIEAAKGHPSSQAELQATSTGIVLRQGCTIALQFLTNNLWLGCDGGTCVGAPCAVRFFEGNDWNKCLGEVFQMYRAKGVGSICVGDFVGLYHPRDKLWFSMWGNYGRKLPCPGTPNRYTGFQTPSAWQSCGGEAFQVYAKGKSVGATITDQDTLYFYYPVSRIYVSFHNDKIETSTCPLDLSGGQRPPSNTAYDHCYYEGVEITIRD